MRRLLAFRAEDGFTNIGFLGFLVAAMYHFLGGNHTVTMWAGWVSAGAFVADLFLIPAALMFQEEEK